MSDGTVVAWRQARAEVIDPGIVKFGGRIVKHTGDGFLAEFKTAHEAVQCAIAMQGGLTSNPPEFRMGISLGDVVDDGDDIHGEAVHNQLGVKFQDLGEHEVKNVSAPIRVYRIFSEETSPLTAAVYERGH